MIDLLAPYGHIGMILEAFQAIIAQTGVRGRFLLMDATWGA
jgi:hypothetical protein